MPSAVVQFIKGAMATGERDLIERHFAGLCAFHTMGEGFTWETQDKARDIVRLEEALADKLTAAVEIRVLRRTARGEQFTAPG